MVPSPSRPTLTVALGVLLLANPLYVDALHLDEPNRYRYESAEVTPGPEGLEVDDRAWASGLDGDVACLADSRPSRACAVEHAILDRGDLTVPVSWGVLVSDHGPLGYQYVYLNGSFYDPVVREEGDRSVLALNRTPADEAMRYVASPLSRASDPVRTAVRSGGVETRRELDGANELWEDDGEYYVVYEVSSRGYGGVAYRRKVRTGRVLETGLTVLGTGVGLFAVLRGQRRRVERERRR